MKTMNSKIVFTMILFCVAFVGVSNAQSERGREQKEPPSFAEIVKELDANEDGKLEESEVKGPLKDDFSKIDTDEDGFISEEELENAPKPKGRRQ